MLSDDYHKPSEFIGSGSIVEMDRSPKHFYCAWKGLNKTSTKALGRGVFFHDLLLEQNIEKYVARPLNEKGELVRSNSKEYIAFLEVNPGKTPIHPDDHKDMYDMLTSFCENSKAMALMKGAKIENSIFVKDPSNGLYLKARPDIWGQEYIHDLKSTSNLNQFEKQIFALKYDIRLVHYSRVVELYTGTKPKAIYFTAYESSTPYCSENFKLSQGDRSAAEDKWNQLANQISVCIKENDFPGPSDEIKEARKPKYFIENGITFEEAG